MTLFPKNYSVFSEKRYDRKDFLKKEKEALQSVPVAVFLADPSVACVQKNELQPIKMAGAVATEQKVNTICAGKTRGL